MTSIPEILTHPAHFVVAVAGSCFLVGIVMKAVTTMVTSTARERSRREIAAYIAAGSMTPEQGERLMRADVKQRLD